MVQLRLRQVTETCMKAASLHERFGIGSVLSVDGTGDSAKARIRFLNVGEKTLLLKFARYKIIK